MSVQGLSEKPVSFEGDPAKDTKMEAFTAVGDVGEPGSKRCFSVRTDSVKLFAKLVR